MFFRDLFVNVLFECDYTQYLVANMIGEIIITGYITNTQSLFTNSTDISAFTILRNVEFASIFQ